jgi:hypothetical protein
MRRVEHEAVMDWVLRYERGWRDQDPGAVDELFTPDARYARSPFGKDRVGHDEIKAFWVEDEVFSMKAEPVAVEGSTAVVRLQVRYGDPHRMEYRDLWVLHFADDGRVDDFEEWPFWPGQAVSSSSDAG